ncbi:MAG: YqaJ viral recombinase family protein [Candidatus Limnocylindrales bacterium]
MTAAVRTGLRQRTPEWLEARRGLVTGTDLPVLLGLSPYKCEADLADEKLAGTLTESNLRMRVGTALEDLIAAEYTGATGHPVQRFRDLVVHPDINWAAASPDRRVVGKHHAVELKWTGSRNRFADGLPQDVEAQVAWTLGVLGWEHGDVAVLVGGDELRVFEQDADPALFEHLVAIAADFRRRLAAGGPFERDSARLRRDYPADNGAEMVADGELDTAVRTLISLRDRRKALEADEDQVERAIKSRMGEVALLRGDGWRASWRRTKDSTVTDWKSLATGLLNEKAETERAALVGLHSDTKPGFRPFRVTFDKE